MKKDNLKLLAQFLKNICKRIDFSKAAWLQPAILQKIKFSTDTPPGFSEDFRTTYLKEHL